MTNDFVIETRNLSRSYGKFVAVDNLNLQIAEGEIFGLLGPNGAGKTTSILMIMGLSEPTAGTVRVCGYDPAREPVKVKRIAGYLPEKVGFYDDLTAKENLEYTGRLNGFKDKIIAAKVAEVLEEVGLSPASDQLVGKFSHGMKQRLGIADVMIKSPKIAVFDEPTSGIDPEGTEQVLSIIKNMAKQKVTVVISSHQLHQVQKICTQVGIFSKGKLVASGSVDKLGREAFRKGKFNIILPISQPTDKLLENIRSIEGVVDINCVRDATVITASEDVSKQVENAVASTTGLKVQMKVEEFELEKVYMEYFKES